MINELWINFTTFAPAKSGKSGTFEDVAVVIKATGV